ncbi:MAG: DUF3276 family protein [Porphyromonadaceae bacterium]|nr:DUF3276 family protein [Porphyromonadaceae bacterium]
MSQEKDWGKATLVSSQRIKAGTRYYYIDAKLDSKGNKYIVLSETKLKEGEAKPERHRIFVYEEDFAKLTRALAETILSLSGEQALAEAIPALSAVSSTQAQPLAGAEASPAGEDEFVPSTALEPTPDTPEDEEDEDLSLETINIEWTDEA